MQLMRLFMSKINKINQKKIDSVHKMETFINMKTLKMLVFDSSYQCNMSAFTLDSACKLWLVSLHEPWTSQHVRTTYVYDVRLQPVGTLLITWVPASVWVADILCMCGARPCASISVPGRAPRRNTAKRNESPHSLPLRMPRSTFSTLFYPRKLHRHVTSYLGSTSLSCVVVNGIKSAEGRTHETKRARLNA